jgi:hypothetical protein
LQRGRKTCVLPLLWHFQVCNCLPHFVIR